jgi:antirestriction protein ArdC
MDTAVPSHRRDVHRAITDCIVSAIEAGTDKSERPWHRPGLLLPMNAATCSYYRGVNVVALWAQAIDRGYATNLWGSYKQWQSRVPKSGRASVAPSSSSTSG